MQIMEQIDQELCEMPQKKEQVEKQLCDIRQQMKQELSDMRQQKEQAVQQLHYMQQQMKQELCEMKEQAVQQLHDRRQQPEQTEQQLCDMKEQIDAYEKTSTNQITQTANFINYNLALSVSRNSIDNKQVPAMNETKIIVSLSYLDSNKNDVDMNGYITACLCVSRYIYVFMFIILLIKIDCSRSNVITILMDSVSGIRKTSKLHVCAMCGWTKLFVDMC